MEENLKDPLFLDRSHVNLRDQVLSILRKAILDLRFEPGERLIERELCELVGVSRTSIREALRHLETEGLVTNKPNVGPTVSVIEASEAAHIYEMREVLEGLAGYLFVERASDAQVQELKDAMDLLSVALSKGGVSDRIQETVHFFDVLLNGCANPLLSATISRQHDRIVLLRASTISSAQRGLESLNEMQAIMDAISARDAKAAQNACMAHVRGARDAALAALNSTELDTDGS